MQISDRPILNSKTTNTLIQELVDECQNVIALNNQLQLSQLSQSQKAEILAELIASTMHLHVHCDEEFQQLLDHELESLSDDDEDSSELSGYSSGQDLPTESLHEYVSALTARYIDTPRLVTLLQWAERVTSKSQGNYSSAAKRAVAIFLALNLRSLTDPRHSHSNDFRRLLQMNLKLLNSLNITIRGQNLLELAVEVSEMQILADVDLVSLITQTEAAISQSQNLSDLFWSRRDIKKLWLDTLKLELDAIALSWQEVDAMRNYFLSCVEIVKAKPSISPEIWERVENELLHTNPQ